MTEQMTPYERAKKVLLDSGKNLDINKLMESFPYFAKAGDGCPWLNPTDEVEEKQFETNWKIYHEEFGAELVDFALKNPPVHFGEKNGEMKRWVGVHSMDDYGFEGMVLKDGTYWRIIDDEICERCKKDELCTEATCKNMHCSKCADFKLEGDI